MDETISLIFEGCKMAKILEANLPNMAMANQPLHLFSSCTEIIKVFTSARENISKNLQLARHGPHQELDPAVSSGLQEWLHTSAWNLLHAQSLPAVEKMKGVVIRDQETAAGALSAVVPPKRPLESGGQVGAEGAASPSGPRASSSQRRGRR